MTLIRHVISQSLGYYGLMQLVVSVLNMHRLLCIGT